MKRVLWALPLLIAALCLYAVSAGEVRCEPGEVRSSYESETLRFSVREARLNGVKCYLTEIWMAEPGRQVVKETAEWGKHLASAETLALRRSDIRLAISASGYISPAYPWIPESFPGESRDYWFTPMASLVVTHGEVLRSLESVPFSGLALEADGLHLYSGADSTEVLAREPRETWSFYDRCPLILDGQDILDRDWDFARMKAVRQVIARLGPNDYLILTTAGSLSLPELTDFLTEYYSPEFAFNLDGGPSAALLRRTGPRRFKAIRRNGQKNVDIMGFTD